MTADNQLKGIKAMVETAKIQDRVKASKVHGELRLVAGGNGPDRETALFFMGQFLAAQAKIKLARTENQEIRQAAKIHGFDLKQFDLAVAERERDDGTTIAGLKTFKRYCELLDLPIGSQMQLFDEPGNAGAASHEGLMRQAYERGYELGIMGRFADDQAYPPMTTEGAEHARGWGDGQTVNLDKLKRLEEMSLESPKRGRKADGDR